MAAAVAEMEQEQEESVMKLVSVSSADREKAVHARCQRDVTDLLLESRIRLQKPLSLAATLPRGGASALLMARVPEAQEAAAAAAAEVEGLFEDLLGLRAALWRQNSALPTPGPWAGTRSAGKRSRDEMLSRLDGADREMEAFRDATIDKWDGKVKTGAGTAAASKFKALNQSVLSQVQTVLEDSSRLVRRTRVKRSTYRVLGAALFPSSDAVPTVENQGEDGGGEAGAGGEVEELEEEGGAGTKGHVEEDEEAYDDADFYQLLLRDLIESAASTEDATELQAQLRAARRRAGKAGKTVDTKASKGRKLRFDVQPKLVNFMFPEVVARPAFTESLIENVFKAS